MSLDITLRSEECKTCGHSEEYGWKNITHNLGEMAEAAGIYKALWRPEEIKCKYAKDIIPLLEKGLAKLKKSPSKFKKYNASNGWGTYEHFVPFVEEVLDMCKEYPDAVLDISR